MPTVRREERKMSLRSVWATSECLYYKVHNFEI